MSDLPLQPQQPKPIRPSPATNPIVTRDKPQEQTTGIEHINSSTMVPAVKNPTITTRSTAQV